jgi:hypothetical protein
MTRPPRALRSSLSLGIAAAALFAAPRARAQGFTMPVGPAPGTAQPTFVEPTPESAVAAKEAPNSVRLFDGRKSRAFYVLDLGPIWARKVDDRRAGEDRQNEERGTGEIAFGMAILNEGSKPFVLSGVQRTLLRVIDSKSFSWSLFVQDLGGGVRLGPLQPEVRIALSTLTIDAFHGEWSAQIFSPRVTAGIGIELGKFRLDMKAHSEYLWRWFGPDYLAHGVTLGLRLEIPRPKSPFVESRQ